MPAWGIMLRRRNWACNSQTVIESDLRGMQLVLLRSFMHHLSSVTLCRLKRQSSPDHEAEEGQDRKATVNVTCLRIVLHTRQVYICIQDHPDALYYSLARFHLCQGQCWKDCEPKVG